MDIDQNALIAAARKVSSNAYARYSNYFVGAAILDDTGNIHIGCNVENTAYPQGICAEANAIGAMVSSGAGRIVAIAIVGGAGDRKDGVLFENAGDRGPCAPCGGCRQRILEFANETTQIILADDNDEVQIFSIGDLLPEAFRVT